MGEQALRDHFAGLAMQNLVTNLNSDEMYKGIATTAYKMADAMLKEREKKEDGGSDE